VAEIVYALDTLEMDGVSTSTSINDVYLQLTRLKPIFSRRAHDAMT